MKIIDNVLDMKEYTKTLVASFADKRIMYSEYLDEQRKHGYNYTKELIVKDKFPRFPSYLKNIILKSI